MQTLGEIRRTVRQLVKRVTQLEQKVNALIEMFATDAFDSPEDEEL